MKIPETVTAYMAAMHDIMQEDTQMKKDILESEIVNQSVYWQLFEANAMSNYALNDGDPTLTSDQFKQIMFEAAKISMENSLKKMKGLGLLEETKDGFKLTQKAIEAIDRANNKD